jgi:cytochrome c553
MIDCRQWRRPRTFLLAVAAILLTLPSQTLAADPPAEKLQLCGTCHGEKGNSTMERTPSLAGQPELFLTNQLILFRERLRKSEAMEPFVKGMPDSEIVALAQHYSKLPAEPTPEPVDAGLAARGAALAKAMHCGSCHLPDLAGREQMPRLAGQRIDYMIDTLIAYREGKRYGVDTSMNGAMYGVSDQDVRALAHFAAGMR